MNGYERDKLQEELLAKIKELITLQTETNKKLDTISTNTKAT